MAERYFAQLTRKNIKTTPARKSAVSSTIQLDRFHKAWHYLLRGHLVQVHREAAPQLSKTDIPVNLRYVVDTLVKEANAQASNASAAGQCLEYMLKHQCLLALVNVSEADFPLGYRGEVIKTFTALVNHLDNRFLIQSAVHRAIIKLNRACAAERSSSVSRYEQETAELLYTICEKIKRLPELLWVFFNERRVLSALVDDGHPATTPVSAQQRYDFPLFSFLLQFVHHTGPPGEFARTAITFVLEMASGPLRDFILEDGNFVVTISATFNALYAELPPRLALLPESNITDVGGTSAAADPSQQLTHLDAYLRYVNFVQQVIACCPSTAITLALLSFIHDVFLHNILLSSLIVKLESDSDMQRVETTVFYIDQTLSVLTSDASVGGPLAKLFIDFLLSDGQSQGSLISRADVLDMEAFVERQMREGDLPSPAAMEAATGGMPMSRSFAELKSLLCRTDMAAGSAASAAYTHERGGSAQGSLPEIQLPEGGIRGAFYRMLRRGLASNWQQLCESPPSSPTAKAQARLTQTSLSLVLSTLHLFETMVQSHWRFALPRIFPNLFEQAFDEHRRQKAQQSGDIGDSSMSLTNLPTELWTLSTYTVRSLSVRSHRRNVERYTALLGGLHALLDPMLGNDAHATSYEAYLQDAEQSIAPAAISVAARRRNSDAGLATVLSPDTLEAPEPRPFDDQEDLMSPLPASTPKPDEFLVILFDLLYRWYTNPPSLNLSLSGLLSALARTSAPQVYSYMYTGDQAPAQQQQLLMDARQPFIYSWLSGMLQRTGEIQAAGRAVADQDRTNMMLLLECAKEIAANLVVQGYTNDTIAFV
ncbi:hypothetical protein RI367_004187 [Sorochytrium milnesiophthora]